jgi:hypothetical protein
MKSPPLNLTEQLIRSHERIEAARARLGDRTVAYLEATLNEIAVDRQCMHLSPVWSRFPTTIPRFTRLPARLQDHPRVTHLLVRCISLLWRILFPGVVLWQALRFAVRKLRAGSCRALADDLVFSNSPRASDRLSQITPTTADWVTVPSGTSQPDTPDVLAYVTWGEFISATFDCLRLNRVTADCLPSKSDRLQFYTAMEWSLMWIGLGRMIADVKTIWFANHYDRWCILIDRYPMTADKRLIQHGMLYGDRQIPSRVKTVSTVYVFDAESAAAFRNCVISNPDVQFINTPYRLQLTPVERRSTDERLVLLVGNLLHAEDEDRLIQMCLELNSLVRILVKPHPRLEQSRYRRCVGERVDVIGPATFPDVDVVLSPESTLGSEYESTGVPVIWYTRIPMEDVSGHISDVLGIDENGRFRSGPTAAPIAA